MTHKRGGEDYGQRRASHTEQYGTSGVFSGWYGKTFRGATGPAAVAEAKKQESETSEPAAATRRESVPAVWEDRRALFQKGRER